MDVKLMWVFAIGTFLAFLFFVEETIQQSELIEKIGIFKVTILVIANSIIGGVVMVTTYYALVQFFPDWHDYLRVGISGMMAMLGKDTVHLYYNFIKKKV